MDCTPFFRTKKLLATWVGMPPLLILLISLGTRQYCNHQRIACEQSETVSRMIPLLRNETAFARQFIKDYAFNMENKASLEDTYIDKINTAADLSGLIVSSINLKQEPINQTLGTARIVASLAGTGTCRQMAKFIKTLKISDLLIYEDHISIEPSSSKSSALRIEAEFARIYIK